MNGNVTATNGKAEHRPGNSSGGKRAHLTIRDIVYEVDVPIKKGMDVDDTCGNRTDGVLVIQPM